jgi:hypothetical protein
MNFAFQNPSSSCPFVDVFYPIVHVLPMDRLTIAQRPERLADPPAEERDGLHATAMRRHPKQIGIAAQRMNDRRGADSGRPDARPMGVGYDAWSHLAGTHTHRAVTHQARCNTK